MKWILLVILIIPLVSGYDAGLGLGDSVSITVIRNHNITENFVKIEERFGVYEDNSGQRVTIKNIYERIDFREKFKENFVNKQPVKNIDKIKDVISIDGKTFGVILWIIGIIVVIFIVFAIVYYYYSNKIDQEMWDYENEQWANSY